MCMKKRNWQSWSEQHNRILCFQAMDFRWRSDKKSMRMILHHTFSLLSFCSPHSLSLLLLPFPPLNRVKKIRKIQKAATRKGGNFFAIYFNLMRENWSRRTLLREWVGVGSGWRKLCYIFVDFIEIDIYFIGRLNAITQEGSRFKVLKRVKPTLNFYRNWYVNCCIKYVNESRDGVNSFKPQQIELIDDDPHTVRVHISHILASRNWIRNLIHLIYFIYVFVCPLSSLPCVCFVYYSCWEHSYVWRDTIACLNVIHVFTTHASISFSILALSMHSVFIHERTFPRHACVALCKSH